MDTVTTLALPVIQDLGDFFGTPNAFRSVLLLIASLALAYYVSNYIAKLIIKFAQSIAQKSDNESNDERVIRLRQIETYLSVAVAFVRASVMLIVGFYVWRIISPSANTTVAAISASTIFIVVAGQTLGMILRDLTAGSAMILERWFNVGDFVKLEPFMDVEGVVERFTLRSIKIRTLSGEVVWVHNQTINGVHVTPRGVRTLAVDVFVSDRKRGEKAIRDIIRAIPKGKLMLAKPLRITSIEEFNENLTQFTIVGQTAPGREWLIERYFVETLKDLDDEDTPRSKRLLVMDPMPRFADPIAEKRFKRAVRIKQEEHDNS